ncbi:eCIS core domain-containing protein [Chitinimonas lacunae]|uniref:DUF4157 domain-containing protein n=1 Tax=Chitinimonas lacunae TaxID=1963018 RepID=A0ABV8MNE2_9NEIS
MSKTVARKEASTPRSQDTPATAAARQGKDAQPALQLDNQTVQWLYANGNLRAKLSVGAADDPVEAEADRMADAALRGAPCTCSAGSPPCPSCRARAAGTIRRKPRNRESPAAVDNLSLGPSRRLAETDRSFFEARFQTDLSDLHIHDSPEAASSAAQLNARAFSVGDRIAFGAGEYQPQTDSGRRLLAHELAHVVQGHGGIRRNGGSEPAAGSASADAGGPPPLPEGPARVEHGSDFDPCAVNVATLTNYQLLAELNHANPVVSAGRDQAGFFDYRNLQRRINAEINRRVQMGHAWLATSPNSIPGTLIRVMPPAADGTQPVLRLPGSAVAGMPEDMSASPLLTEGQFQGFVDRQQLETIRADEYRRRMIEQWLAGSTSSMVSGSQLYNTPLDRALLDPYSRPILGSTGGEIMKWRGRFGEAAFSSRASQGFGLFLDDLNARTWQDRRGVTHQPTEENFPIFDFERTAASRSASILGTARISVKTSLQPDQGGRFDYYRKGLQAMLETSRRSTLPTYISNQPQFSGQPTSGPQYEANRSQVLSDAYLAINSDDVTAFREMLSDPTRTETPQSTVALWDDRGQRQPNGPPRAGWRQVFVGEMRENPVSINGQSYNSPDALDQALSSGQITADQHRQAQREVGRRAANRVVGAGILGAEVSGLRSSRMSFSALSEQQIRSTITREFMRSQRLGGGVRGELRAAGGAGLHGAGTGSVIAVLTTAGVMLWDEQDHPEWGTELATSGGVGAVSNFFGSSIEQGMISRGTSIALNDVAATGASRLSPAMLTRFGRFGGGGVGSGIGELISIGALEDREHSGAEVGVRTTRAFVLGGSSAVIGAEVGAGAVVLSTAIAGAAGGSIAPGVGTAIGFLVGLVAGGVVYYLGDRVVPGGRDYWDALEAGCQPPPPQPSASSGYSSILFSCFAADTPVTLADGSSRPISELAVGDQLLSYNEREKRLEARRVETIHAAPPATMLALAFSDGTILHVTPAHKLSGPQGWLAAAELRAGDVLWSFAQSDPARLTSKTLAAVSNAPPRGTVYDLSVEATHTYFAAGVLAHNKLP